jgi:Carboxypeptidase regulatory-like domain
MFDLLRATRLLALGLILWHSSATLCAQNPNAEQSNSHDAKFKIAGTIVNALNGAPIGKARVSIFDTSNRANSAWMITSENGHFEFPELKAGKFSLQGAKRGFISAAYDQHEQYSTAIVTGAGLDTERLVLRLTPLAVLAGQILDEAGDPVRHAHVTLYQENHAGGLNRITPVSSASTDDQGSYEFPSLAPGNYFVSVAAKPWYAVHPVSSSDGTASPPPGVASSLDVAYSTTYYSGATEADGATPIPVRGGDRLQIDVHLNPVPALHLVFRVPNDQQGFSWPVFQKRVFDSVENVQAEGTQSVAPGVYELTGVPAGKYIVRRSEPKTRQLLQSNEMDLTRNGQELDESISQPVGAAKLSVKLPRGDQFPKQFSIALQDSRRRTVAFRPVDTAGEVTFGDLPADKYAILVFSPTKPYSVVRTSSQGVEASGHELNVTPGASLDVTVFLAGGVVTLEGFAKRGEKPMAGAMVILVPKDPESHQEMLRRDQSDLDGSFVLRGVIPGAYTIVAVEDAWGFAWLQPSVLSRYVQYGQNVTIGELMEGSMHLPDPVEVQPR